MRSSRTRRIPPSAAHLYAVGYAPRVELLDLLRADDFRVFICTGGGRDFVRPIADEMYGVPRENVIGSGRPSSIERATSTVRRASSNRSTTGRASPSTSGREPVTGRCSPAATRTATSRCSRRPASGSLSTTTTRSGSSPTTMGPSARSRKRRPVAGPSRACGTTSRPCSTAPECGGWVRDGRVLRAGIRPVESCSRSDRCRRFSPCDLRRARTAEAFTMGETSPHWAYPGDGEGPVHEVALGRLRDRQVHRDATSASPRSSRRPATCPKPERTGGRSCSEACSPSTSRPPVAVAAAPWWRQVEGSD